MVLYPTETIYGLGVNPFDEVALNALFELKGRDELKACSLLVRNIDDVEEYADVSATAARIAQRFLPGPLTLVLPAKDTVPDSLKSKFGVSFRVSSDPLAQNLIEQHFTEHMAPLTCTSANVSGLPTLPTPKGIIEQFKKHRPYFTGFSEVIDGGVRTSKASTVVSVDLNKVMIIREGVIPKSEILAMV